MINLPKASTTWTNNQEDNGTLLNELTNNLNTMTFLLGQYGDYYNNAKVSTTFTNL